jgi:hypothetical protein
VANSLDAPSDMELCALRFQASVRSSGGGESKSESTRFASVHTYWRRVHIDIHYSRAPPRPSESALAGRVWRTAPQVQADLSGKRDMAYSQPKPSL